MRVDQFCDKLLYAFEDRAYKNRYVERSAFDPISKKILSVLIENELAKRNSKFAMIWIARLCSITKRQVMTRMHHLARYGLIKVIHNFRDDGTGLNDSNSVELNPIMMGIYSNAAPSKTFNSFCDHYYDLGFKRLDIETKAVQGFFCDCEYGYPEPERKDGINKKDWQKSFIDLISKSNDEKADKQLEALTWLRLSAEFVEGCAKLWTKAQGGMGYGYNKPVWCGEISALGPTPKRERSELVKLFKTWGGFETAVAWYIFVCGIPQTDAKGKLSFDLKHPHRQFVTTDKKPSQFAKHWNAILSDEIFSIMTSEEHIENTTSELSNYFSDVLKVKPKVDQFKTTV